MTSRSFFKRKWPSGLKNIIIEYSLNFSIATIRESTHSSPKYFYHSFRSSKTQMNFKNSNLQISKSKNKSIFKKRFLTCLERATKPLSSEMPLILAVFLDRLKESKESKTKFYSKKCMATRAWLIAVSLLSLNTIQAWGISSEAETKRRKSILRWDTQIKLPTVF